MRYDFVFWLWFIACMAAWGCIFSICFLLLNKKKKPATREPVIHDYSREKRHWGHDYCITAVIERGRELRMMGWGHSIESGDFILMENENETTRYKVESVNYLSDPTDMWSMTASFAPRSAPTAPPNSPSA